MKKKRRVLLLSLRTSGLWGGSLGNRVRSRQSLPEGQGSEKGNRSVPPPEVSGSTSRVKEAAPLQPPIGSVRQEPAAARGGATLSFHRKCPTGISPVGKVRLGVQVTGPAFPSKHPGLFVVPSGYSILEPSDPSGSEETKKKKLPSAGGGAFPPALKRVRRAPGVHDVIAAGWGRARGGAAGVGLGSSDCRGALRVCGPG